MSVPPIPTAPLSAAANGLWTSQPFSTTVDLSGLHYMPQQVVGSVLAFTAGATAAGGSNSVRLVADGVNAPTFTGIIESGLSSGYNNTAGIINELAFWHDGYNAWFAAAQQVNAQPTPILSSATLSTTAPTQLVLAYSAALNATAPATSAFSLTASGGAVTVSSIAISLSTVTLTLSRSIGGAETLAVSYTAPGTNPIQSLSGVVASSFTAQSVTITSPPAPSLSSAAITSGTAALVLTYSLALNTSAPATSAFSVTASGGAASVSSVAISGSAVTLTLSRNILSGETVTCSYTAPGTNPVQTTAGGLAASFTGQSVSVSVAAVPTLTSANLTGTTSVLTLTYSLSLNTTAPATSAYAVTASGGAATVSSISISGAVVTLNLSRAIAGTETVSLTYTQPGSNPVETPAGGLAPSFTGQAVSVSSGPTISLSSATLNTSAATSLLLTYATALNTTAPATSAYSVTASGGAVSVSSIAISGDVVTLTLSRSINGQETMSVSYTAPGTNPVQSTGGSLAVSFSGQAVAITSAAPTLSSAAITAGTAALALTWSLTMNTTAPATSAFAITASGGAATVSSIAISGAVVTLTLSRTIGSGETVTCAYTQPGTNKLQSAAGGLAASFSGQAVTVNASGTFPVSGAQPIQLTSGGGATQVSDATYSGYYDYDSNGQTYTAANSACSTVGIPASTDGYFGLINTGSTGGAMVGIVTTPGAVVYGSVAYGVYANASNYACVTSGVGGGAPDNTIAAAVGDILRMRRASTSLIAEVSKDNGSTWQTIKTWTGVTTAKIYYNVSLMGANALAVFSSSGVA